MKRPVAPYSTGAAFAASVVLTATGGDRFLAVCVRIAYIGAQFFPTNDEQAIFIPMHCFGEGFCQ